MSKKEKGKPIFIGWVWIFWAIFSLSVGILQDSLSSVLFGVVEMTEQPKHCKNRECQKPAGQKNKPKSPYCSRKCQAREQNMRQGRIKGHLKRPTLVSLFERQKQNVTEEELSDLFRYKPLLEVVDYTEAIHDHLSLCVLKGKPVLVRLPLEVEPSQLSKLLPQEAVLCSFSQDTFDPPEERVRKSHSFDTSSSSDLRNQIPQFDPIINRASLFPPPDSTSGPRAQQSTLSRYSNSLESETFDETVPRSDLLRLTETQSSDCIMSRPVNRLESFENPFKIGEGLLPSLGSFHSSNDLTKVCSSGNLGAPLTSFESKGLQERMSRQIGEPSRMLSPLPSESDGRNSIFFRASFEQPSRTERTDRFEPLGFPFSTRNHSADSQSVILPSLPSMSNSGNFDPARPESSFDCPQRDLPPIQSPQQQQSTFGDFPSSGGGLVIHQFNYQSNMYGGSSSSAPSTPSHMNLPMLPSANLSHKLPSISATSETDFSAKRLYSHHESKEQQVPPSKRMKTEFV